MKAILLGTLMVIFAGVLPAMAAPCHQQQVILQKQVQAVEVVYPVVQQVQVIVPVYGIVPYQAAYYAPPASPFVAPQEDRFERLMQLLEQRLSALPANALPLQVATASTACAKCHNGSTDAPKLNFSSLTAGEKALVAERVLDGSMPPKGGVPKADRRAALAELLK